MAISVQERLASQMYWLTGHLHVGPYLPGVMEQGELAHVQGLYAGVSFSTGVVVIPDAVASLKPLWRGGTRRR